MTQLGTARPGTTWQGPPGLDLVMVGRGSTWQGPVGQARRDSVRHDGTGPGTTWRERQGRTGLGVAGPHFPGFWANGGLSTFLPPF
jgi:hypothetical protein